MILSNVWKFCVSAAILSLMLSKGWRIAAFCWVAWALIWFIELTNSMRPILLRRKPSVTVVDVTGTDEDGGE